RRGAQSRGNGRVSSIKNINARLQSARICGLNQSVSSNRHRILPVMAAAALPVVLRRLRHNQRHFDRIAQSNQTIRQLSRPVKRLDLIPEVSQLTNRARQPVRTAHETNVVPHNVLNSLHVALDQRRIRFSTQTTLVPPRNVFKLRILSVSFTQRSFEFDSSSITPNQSFEKRSRSETIRAMYACTTDLTHRVQITNRGTCPFIHQNATAEIMRCRHNRHGLD